MSQQYCDFSISATGDLEIAILPEFQEAIMTQDGLADLLSIRSTIDTLTDDLIFLELIDHQLCNGYVIVDPASVGWLTEALIIASEGICLDRRLYSNMGWYHVTSPIEKLRRGSAVFHRA